jgi:hypothetical protein
MPSFAELWNYIGPILGVILGVVGTYILERRKERITKRDILQTVECVELVNAKILDEEMLGPLKKSIQIRIMTKPGQEPEFYDAKELYFARYQFRNLSDAPVAKFIISLENLPQSIWSSVKQGDEQRNPDWSQQFNENMNQPRDVTSGPKYPFPYLNPYKTTKQEVFLDIASHLPLDGIKVIGGAQGIKFVFKKSSEIRSK